MAQIIRAKGLTGELVVAPAVSLPLDVWEGLRLWVVPPDHDLVRETRVCSVAEQSAGLSPTLVLALEGVADRTTAQRLVGRYLLARADDCSDVRGDICGAAADGHDIQHEADEKEPCVGLTVMDETYGLLGTIIEERRGIAQTLWVVDGPFGEVLIPAVDEFIAARGTDVVTVRVPNGLLELNG
jgi:16S rRNA processing protein RimM